MLRSAIPLLILLCICVAPLSGCGQSGPLYLPDDKAPQTDTTNPAADDEQAAVTTDPPTDETSDQPTTPTP